MPEKGQKHSSEAEEKGKESSQGNENYRYCGSPLEARSP